MTWWWRRRKKRWALPDTEDGGRAIEEAQARLDATKQDDHLVAGLVRTNRSRQHDYLAAEIVRTFGRVKHG